MMYELAGYAQGLYIIAELDRNIRHERVNLTHSWLDSILRCVMPAQYLLFFSDRVELTDNDIGIAKRAARVIAFHHL